MSKSIKFLNRLVPGIGICFPKDAAIFELLLISLICSSNHLVPTGIQCADKIHIYFPEDLLIALFNISPGIYLLNFIYFLTLYF